MDGLIQYHAAIDPDVARTKLPSSPVPPVAPAGFEPALVSGAPTWHYANLNLQVDGLPLAVSAAHAKLRRDGYRV